MLPAPVLEETPILYTPEYGIHRGDINQSIHFTHNNINNNINSNNNININNNINNNNNKLELIKDYPEPLTSTQRELIRRHTSYTIRRYHQIKKGINIISKGYHSLQQLLLRLEKERATVLESLHTLASSQATNSELINNELEKVNNSSNNNNNDNNNNSLINTNTNISKRRTGGLLRSAVFANLHNVLKAAKREEKEEEARTNVTLEREKIRKTTQLKIIENDIAEQQKHLAPLSEKYEKSQVMLENAKGKVLEMLKLYHEMQYMEVAYASRFFLRASGGQKENNDNDNEENNNNNNNNDNEENNNNDNSNNASYDIFFTPAKYTDEVQDIIREQIEEGLDEYLEYRQRINPILELLTEEQKNKETKRANQLLQLIGVNTEDMNIITVNSEYMFASNVGLAPPLIVSNKTGKETTNNKNNNKTTKIKVPGQISDDEDEDDDIVENDNNLDNDEIHMSNEPLEKRQRDQINSALAALDDFEELY